MYEGFAHNMSFERCDQRFESINSLAIIALNDSSRQKIRQPHPFEVSSHVLINHIVYKICSRPRYRRALFHVAVEQTDHFPIHWSRVSEELEGPRQSSKAQCTYERALIDVDCIAICWTNGVTRFEGAGVSWTGNASFAGASCWTNDGVGSCSRRGDKGRCRGHHGFRDKKWTCRIWSDVNR